MYTNLLLFTWVIIFIFNGCSDCKLIKPKFKKSQNVINVKSNENDIPAEGTDTAYYNQFSSVDARIKAEVTRGLLHTVNGAMVSTKFKNTEFPSYTYSTIQMVADVNNTKYGGIPYFIFSYNDSAYKDLLADNRASVLFTDSTTGQCNYWVLGSKDRNCHRAVFLGPFVDASREESRLVYPEFVRRYPGVKNLNETNYFIAKVDTKAIFISEFERLNLTDYYRARPYGWDLKTDQGTGPPVFPERALTRIKRQ